MSRVRLSVLSPSSNFEYRPESLQRERSDRERESAQQRRGVTELAAEEDEMSSTKNLSLFKAT
jgi:hypothetical protein